jgi:hypothetical protein
MPATIDMTGMRCGRLTVVERAPSTPSGHVRWRACCACGGEVLVTGGDLRSGHTKSCGCHKADRLARRNRGPEHRTEAAEMCRNRSGPRSPGWLGDGVGYDAAHGRVKRAHGPAANHDCIDGCGRPAGEWSYTGVPGEWSPHVEDYEPRCVPCHSRYDALLRRLLGVAAA